MRRQQGFTLVEMLVSISVAALLIGVVYGAVRIGQRSATAVEQRVESAEIMRIGWEFMHNALTRARAIPNPQDSEDTTSFNGKPNALSFVADMPAYVGLGGLMRITLETAHHNRKTQLLLTRYRFDTSGETTQPDKDAERAVLVDDLEDFSVAYFGAGDHDQEPSWRSNWYQISTLPNLIRIEVKPKGEDEWPEMIAAPSIITSLLDSEDFMDSDGEQSTAGDGNDGSDGGDSAGTDEHEVFPDNNHDPIEYVH